MAVRAADAAGSLENADIVDADQLRLRRTAPTSSTEASAAPRLSQAIARRDHCRLRARTPSSSSRPGTAAGTSTATRASTTSRIRASSTARPPRAERRGEHPLRRRDGPKRCDRRLLQPRHVGRPPRRARRRHPQRRRRRIRRVGFPTASRAPSRSSTPAGATAMPNPNPWGRTSAHENERRRFSLTDSPRHERLRTTNTYDLDSSRRSASPAGPGCRVEYDMRLDTETTQLRLLRRRASGSTSTARSTFSGWTGPTSGEFVPLHRRSLGLATAMPTRYRSASGSTSTATSSSVDGALHRQPRWSTA